MHHIHLPHLLLTQPMIILLQIITNLPRLTVTNLLHLILQISPAILNTTTLNPIQMISSQSLKITIQKIPALHILTLISKPTRVSMIPHFPLLQLTSLHTIMVLMLPSLISHLLLQYQTIHHKR